jgi:hypothetical protein
MYQNFNPLRCILKHIYLDLGINLKASSLLSSTHMICSKNFYLLTAKKLILCCITKHFQTYFTMNPMGFFFYLFVGVVVVVIYKEQ